MLCVVWAVWVYFGSGTQYQEVCANNVFIGKYCGGIEEGKKGNVCGGSGIAMTCVKMCITRC